MPEPYPRWKFYPSYIGPPEWVAGVLDAFIAARRTIESGAQVGLTSDAALAELRPFLEGVGFQIETGKRKAEKIRRPVFFGDEGHEGKT